MKPGTHSFLKEHRVIPQDTPGEGMENSFTRQAECEQMSSSRCFLSFLWRCCCHVLNLSFWLHGLVIDWLIKSLTDTPEVLQKPQSCLSCSNTNLRSKVDFLSSFCCTGLEGGGAARGKKPPKRFRMETELRIISADIFIRESWDKITLAC